MAYYQNKVLLGFEDDPITEKNKGQVNYTTNKIGGEPDLPVSIHKLDKFLTCKLCQLPLKLVVQVYAPLEGSKYHRTLYLFACIHPNCWNHSESWKCFRVQVEESFALDTQKPTAVGIKLESTDWCTEADDWGDTNDNNAFLSEENCNMIQNFIEKNSDDEESGSLEDSVSSNLNSLSIDERNANNGAYGGAVGRLHSPGATAEIEGNEVEVITVDTPTVPKVNLAAILNEAPQLPEAVSREKNVSFLPYFMSVWEEEDACSNSSGSVGDNHVKELLTNYQQANGDFSESEGHQRRTNNSGVSGEGDVNLAMEEYEQAKPAHGDMRSHHFISKIQSNPGQILRYERGGSPLLLHSLQEPLKYCQHCQADLTFEFQLVPTIISKLWLVCDTTQQTRLDFGTVLVYTCKKSCWSSNDYFKEEIVFVQRENL